MPTTWGSRLRIAGVVLAVAAGAAACGGGSNDNGTGATSVRDAGAPPNASGGSGPLATGGKADSAATRDVQTLARAVQGSDVIYTANVGITTDDVPGAVTRVRAIVAGAGGYVFDSAVEAGDRPSATLTFKLPPAAFQATLDRIGKEVDEVTSVQQRAEDVSDQVVDIETRLAVQRSSVTRVRALLDKATSIEDIVRLESELTRREAELESLEGRLGVLKEQVRLATLTVTVTHTEAADDEAGGFLGGLRKGWHAFTASGTAALVVLGAVLPFAALALLVGTAWVVNRRRRAPRPAPPETA